MGKINTHVLTIGTIMAIPLWFIGVGFLADVLCDFKDHADTPILFSYFAIGLVVTIALSLIPLVYYIVYSILQLHKEEENE